uniref:Tick transposon n=1 Tax=Rhipicephalus appendiculatus TaxID=34631 RepID=A0A131YS31_RHIAP
METIEISREGVFQQLLKLDTKKSSGPDGIPTVFLKRYAEWMSHYLTIIFQKTYTTQSLPQDWRTAFVIPVFKGGNRKQATNYRPVSLTSVSCKVFEHIIAKLRFVDQNTLLYPCQHGFRTGLSTVTQLIETIHDFAAAVDISQQVDVVCVDFAKAFDKVSRVQLIFKLRNAGINELVVKWIEAYLTNRTQVVNLDGHLSDPLAVLSGVPQGSVLGPLLFLLYINDISSIAEEGVQVKLFADDCLIYATITKLDDQLRVQNCLQHLDNWCRKWKMAINYSKSTYTHISRRKTIHSFSYSIDGHLLVHAHQFKYLGVTITQKLTWNEHMDNVCTKAYQKLYILRKKLEHASRDVKYIAYTTFVRTILEYSAVVWSPHQVTFKKKLERIQRLAARFICSTYRRKESVTLMLRRCNLDSLELRRNKYRLKVLFQIMHDQLKIDKLKYLHAPGKRNPRTNHD